MPTITLTTDLGLRDFYTASIKAKIISQIPDCQIIDISNDVEKFNIGEAAYFLSSTISDFPKDTVHIVGVGSLATDNIRHLGIRYRDQYIIAPDNGFFSLIANQYPDIMVELTMNSDTDLVTFPIRDLYTPAAIHLARGGTLEVIGRRTENYLKRALIPAQSSEHYIKGMIMYVDDFGNAISNINEELIKKVGKGRRFIVGFIQKGYDIDQLEKRYEDVGEGDRLATINGSGWLEIAINRGHAANLLGLHRGETVIVSFDD
jgi:S-adenosyl-L-methionine hydrolase (adenosine-forming)